jgi:hypothetical protein
VLRFNESTGAFVDQIDPKNLAGLNEVQAMEFSPDHNPYLSDDARLTVGLGVSIRSAQGRAQRRPRTAAGRVIGLARPPWPVFVCSRPRRLLLFCG